MRVADYDLLVIGSGPAGCAVALNAIRYGLSVLMITSQKQDLPIDLSLPSESLHPGVVQLLDHLHVSFVLESCYTGRYPGIQSESGVELFATADEADWQGYHIQKSRFQNELLREVASAKTAILFDEKIKRLITTDHCVCGAETMSGKTIFAKYVIDASGRSEVAAKLLGIKPDFHSPPLLAWSGKVSQLAGNHPVFENRYARFRSTDYGWTWLVPEDNQCCSYTSLSIKGTPHFEIPAELLGQGIHAPIIKHNVRWRIQKSVAQKGVLLCGDAAAMIDPAAGQGILHALYSGIKASETVVSILRKPEMEEHHIALYSRWLSSEFERKKTMLKTYYSSQKILRD